MASSPTSPKIVFRDQAGTIIPQPREWEPAFIEVSINPDRWSDVRLLVNGTELIVSLARRWDADRILAEWRRSGPGTYRLGVEVDRISQEITIHIPSAKLGPNGIASLVDDLQRTLPTSIAIGIQRLGGLTGVRLQDPAQNTLAQEILRLKRAVYGADNRMGLSQLLPLIGADPHHILTSEDEWRQRHRARRIPTARLNEALTRPGNVDAARMPVMVFDRRAEHTYDVHENRLTKLFLTEVQNRLRRLDALISIGADGYQAEVGECYADLNRAARSAPFLNDVSTPVYLPNQITMVLLKEARYRALLDSYLEFRSSIWASIDDWALDAPLENLPHLYEVWGTLEVTDTLLEIAGELGFELLRESITRPGVSGLFIEVLPSNRPVLELVQPSTGLTLAVIPQRTYGQQDEPHSVSFPQRPDVAIELRAANGRRRVIILDPKYKLDGDDTSEARGTPVKSDIDKMHAYRDAIVGADGEHLVDFAATLYPGETQRFGPGVAAIGALPEDAADIKINLTAAIARSIANLAMTN